MKAIIDSTKISNVFRQKPNPKNYFYSNDLAKSCTLLMKLNKSISAHIKHRHKPVPFRKLAD